MNKKIILPISLMLLVGLATLVLAGELRVPVEKGWNLIYGLNSDNPAKDILSGSEIQSDNIKAIYVYIPQINDYGRLYPNPEVEKILSYLTVNDLEQSVYWVYSNKQGTGKFNVDEPIEFSQRILISGWNFFPFYDSMLHKKVEEFKGNCEVEKIYAWDPTQQKWDDMLNKGFDNQELYGLGIAIKVKDECKFGEPQTNIEPPPVVPN